MRLGELAATLGIEVRGDGTGEVTGITHRAQAAEPGWVFAALPGARHHGIEFLSEALARGAVAVLSDRESAVQVPQLLCEDPRRAAALAAWALAGHPERRLKLVGVTGTNGKSTVVNLIGCLATAAGQVGGVFGTLGYQLPTRTQSSSLTTFEPTDLAPLLQELVAAGGTLAAMEVSSAGLYQRRVAGLEYDVAVWLNLTRDHLDFHRDMEDYFAAKATLQDLLRREPPGRRVIGADDPFMARLAASPRPGDLTFGLEPGRDVTASHVQADVQGMSFTLTTPAGTMAARLPLIGRHNLTNALAASATGIALGYPLDAIAAGLATARPLPGRLEPVDVGGGFAVFVDYAHTPDALEKVLTALRELTAGRLVAVFGCGGDKDKGKRPVMGEIAGRLADIPVVTSDNPRSEDPVVIVNAVMDGVRAAGNPHVLGIPDRREAIAAALSLAQDGDVVVVAGKGHEQEQIFADRRIPFDDRQVIRELARRRRG
jgi:UDP-N-acetylmuramoyl-L-alanyl-D-glutamate--2,6-diaminopimelate ligase